MNYSDIITRAFRTLKAGGIWGFVITIQLTVLALLGFGLAAGVSAAGGPGVFRQMVTDLSAPGVPSQRAIEQFLTHILTIYGLFAAGAFLTIPISLIMHGGLIHLTDEAQAGRSATVGGGWAFGARRIGRVFAVEFMIGLVAFALILLGILPIVFSAIAAGVNRSGGGAVVGLVCGGSLWLMLMLFALIMLGGWEALAIRYAVIGDRTAGDAIGAGWDAFRARFGSVFVFLLILFGFGVVVYVVQSVLNYAIEFAVLGPSMFTGAATGPSASGVAFLRFQPMFPLLMLLALTVTVLTRVLQAAMWTGFFRQMTGLQPSPPSTYTPYPYGPYPAPTQPQAGYPAQPGGPQSPIGYAPGQPPQSPEVTYGAYPGPYPYTTGQPSRPPNEPYTRHAEERRLHDPYTAQQPEGPPMATQPAETPAPTVPPVSEEPPVQPDPPAQSD